MKKNTIKVALSVLPLILISVLWSDDAGNCPGDLNGDGKVDYRDIEIVCRNFGGSALMESFYNPDINGDGTINIVDLVLVAKNYGSVCWQPSQSVNATSMRGKTMCGYQGWFRCPGDGSGLGWVHWSINSQRIEPDTLTFEMWPDMSEYSDAEKYEAPGFTYPNGEQAHLFSSVNKRTVLRHFKWMQQYGIDGVWLQRFLVSLEGGPSSKMYPSGQEVLRNVQKAASRTGRIWALAYDVAQMPSDDLFDVMVSDWKKLVDSGVTKHSRYLHHQGKPVLCIWDFSRSNITQALANRIIDFFKYDPEYAVFLVGGILWTWYRDDSEWVEFSHRFDAICLWNVGNYSTDRSGKKWATTSYWEAARMKAEKTGMLYIPVIYPGFSWDNLKKQPPGTTIIPREDGLFYWKQFYAATQLGLDMVYVAMFDEVDEGTAIFKVTNDPPTQAHFVTYDGLPNDWYLRLTGEGIKVLRGEREITPEIPISP